MKLTVFQSDKGDCLLLTGRDRKSMLIDGGMSSSYAEHVAPVLASRKLRAIDVVCVSHIDQDHISGILRLVRDLADWRAHEFKAKRNEKTKPPKSIRPPEIKEIWHNAFHQQVEDNEGRIENLLAANAVMLASGVAHSATGKLAGALMNSYENLATSEQEAIKLSNLIGPSQLGIPLNRPAGGKLMMVRGKKKQKVVELGGMSVSILAPFEEDLNKLRVEWNAWLEDNEATLKKIQKKAQADEGRFATDEIGSVKDTMTNEGELLSQFHSEEMKRRLGALEKELREKLDAVTDPALKAFEARRLDRIAALRQAPEVDLAQAAKTLGLRSKVTAPNLASLMLLVVETAGAKKKTVLLTGDGHADEILKGLNLYLKPDKATGRTHVDVLKVQHHGAEYNIHAKFCEEVTADHYVFCGNGAHANPDVDVLDLIHGSRMVAGDEGKFKFWFNSSSEVTSGENKKQMRKIEKRVGELQASSGGRMMSAFLSDHSFDLSI